MMRGTKKMPQENTQKVRRLTYKQAKEKKMYFTTRKRTNEEGATTKRKQTSTINTTRTGDPHRGKINLRSKINLPSLRDVIRL